MIRGAIASLAFGVALVLCAGSALVHAQPDPRQMSGIPRPVTDLPDGSVSVRVIRGALTNNIPNQVVELHVGGKVLTAKTDDAGRAQFDKLTPGATLKATTVVDGEALQSEEFPAPAQGGIRLLLVAAGGAGGGPAASAEPSVPAVAGEVTIGKQTRVVFEPGDETLAVYYLLEIVNNARTPVNPSTLFTFDMPTGTTGTGLLQGSSPLASVTGTHVLVRGPFPPGSTLVQVGGELPVTSGALDITQRFPASLEQFSLIVKKVGDMKVTSPQLTMQQDMAAEGETFIAGSGGRVAAGQALSFSLSGLPHNSTAPRWIALALVLVVIVAGAWASMRGASDADARASERKRLVARREKLFGELVRLEREHHQGRGDERRYASRREELVSALEHIYGALDSDDALPDPGSTAGVIA